MNEETGLIYRVDYHWKIKDDPARGLSRWWYGLTPYAAGDSDKLTIFFRPWDNNNYRDRPIKFDEELIVCTEFNMFGRPALFTLYSGLTLAAYWTDINLWLEGMKFRIKPFFGALGLTYNSPQGHRYLSRGKKEDSDYLYGYLGGVLDGWVGEKVGSGLAPDEVPARNWPTAAELESFEAGQAPLPPNSGLQPG